MSEWPAEPQTTQTAVHFSIKAARDTSKYSFYICFTYLAAKCTFMMLLLARYSANAEVNACLNPDLQTFLQAIRTDMLFYDARLNSFH